MIEQKSVKFTFAVVFCISVLSAILSYFQIPYQLYIWEIFIDAKVIALALFVFFLYKRKTLQFPKIKVLLLTWSWKRNIFYFFFPLFLYLIAIIAGLLVKEVSLNKLDNAITLVLATLFDIPAIFVFSSTSILIEEIFFRGIILSTIQGQYSQLKSIVVANILWIVYSVSEIIGIKELNLLKFISVAIYFLSMGIMCSVLKNKYQSIWFGYSLRVGVITLTPIIISSLISESDSFFVSNSLLFVAEGIAVSCLFLLCSVQLFKSSQMVLETPQENLES